MFSSLFCLATKGATISGRGTAANPHIDPLYACHTMRGRPCRAAMPCNRGAVMANGTTGVPGWRRHAHNVADMRAMARRRLPRMVFDFADGAADDERTLRRNEEAFAELAFLPSPLNGTGERDAGVELFGRRLELPVIIGPTGSAGMFWPHGEVETARAAAAAGTVYVMSHGSTASIEDLAKLHTGRRWFQVFMYRDRSGQMDRGGKFGYPSDNI